ncbi:MAG: photosystem I reaction center subunit PsaK [Microcoleaceae cyanobacterium]
MIHLTMLVAVTPQSITWSPKVGLIMILCNILAIAIGKYTISIQDAKPELPMPEMFGGMGLPALLGTTSLGHIIGAGAILGLVSIGAL